MFVLLGSNCSFTLYLQLTAHIQITFTTSLHSFIIFGGIEEETSILNMFQVLDFSIFRILYIFRIVIFKYPEE